MNIFSDVGPTMLDFKSIPENSVFRFYGKYYMKLNSTIGRNFKATAVDLESGNLTELSAYAGECIFFPNAELKLGAPRYEIPQKDE
jgi:hypothetical protein